MSIEKFVFCDNCCEKIYIGENISYIDGLTYIACSDGCLCNLIANVKHKLCDKEEHENDL